MNAKKFSAAMSELDTKYVDEALNHKKKAKRPGWIKWGAMAACLCLVVYAGIRLIPTDSTPADPCRLYVRGLCVVPPDAKGGRSAFFIDWISSAAKNRRIRHCWIEM